MDGTPTERRGGAPAGIRRLKADQPSKAITGAARNEFIHPTADRALTIRECARIQTFPDAFAFAGSASDQMRHIGNAVPPVLAHCVAIALRNSLLRGTEPSTTIGRLLSFVPTRSNGTSPALKAVISNVADRYGPSHQVAGLPLWP
jgi:DNA (cytosine-5)-methyltransferase 1